MQRRKALRDKEFKAVMDLAGSVFGRGGSRRVGYVNPMAPVCRGFQLGCVGSTVVVCSTKIYISMHFFPKSALNQAYSHLINVNNHFHHNELYIT